MTASSLTANQRPVFLLSNTGVTLFRSDQLPRVSANGKWARKHDLNTFSDKMLNMSDYGELSSKLLKIKAYKY